MPETSQIATNRPKPTKVVKRNVKSPEAASIFLAQLLEDEDMAAPGLSYAASVLLPLTGWAEENFVERLRGELCRLSNLMILEREIHNQSEGRFNNFVISLMDAKDKPIYLKVGARRMRNGRVVAILTPAYDSDGFNPKNYNRLLNIIDNFPGYVALIDSEHKILFENKAFFNYFGSAFGRSCHESMRQSDKPCTVCQPFEVWESGTPGVSEWASPDGKRAFRVYSYPFEDADSKKSLLTIGLDITAGLRTRVALDQSEERYRTIADNLSHGIAVMGKNLLIGASNVKLREWFGADAARGKPFYALFNDPALSDPENKDSILHRTFDHGKNHEMEVALNLNGEKRHFRLSCFPVFTAKKHVRAIVAMLEDITERKLVEVNLFRVRRLEAMGNLAAGIAHEINQPLSAVHLYAAGLEMLLEKNNVIPQEIIRERLHFILREAGKIKEIIAHMRALVLQGSDPELDFVSLKYSLSEALSLLGAQLKSHGIILIDELSDSLPLVRANKVQLEQVMVNLLVNAMHALDTVPETIPNTILKTTPSTMPDIIPGTIPSIMPGGEARGKRILVRAIELPDRRMALQVIDNGPGLGGAEDKIFDPFFSGEAGGHQGMGLGLSIVHTFVQSWGGNIVAGSVTNGHSGAVFQIILHTEQSLLQAVQAGPNATLDVGLGTSEQPNEKL